MSRLPQIATPTRKPYPSDLSDAEWRILQPLLPKSKGFGHPRTVDLREILNGIFYVVQKTGCQWEMLPHDLPPYTTVYGYFQKWQRKGTWQEIHDQLRWQIRQTQGRDTNSTIAIADSQSVKTTEKSGAAPLGFPQHDKGLVRMYAHQDRGQSMALMVAKKLKDVNGTRICHFSRCL